MVMLMTVEVHNSPGMRRCLHTVLTAQKTCHLPDVMFHKLQKVKVKNTTNLWPDQATEVFLCFFLSCKTNARV